MKIGKSKKLVINLHNKTEYVIHIIILKEALNHGIIFKRVYRVIKFNQKAWLRPQIDMNTKLRQKVKKFFEKDFFKLMNNEAFGKIIGNVRKHKEILNLQIQKGEEIIQYQNQIIILESVSQKTYQKYKSEKLKY